MAQSRVPAVKGVGPTPGGRTSDPQQLTPPGSPKPSQNTHTGEDRALGPGATLSEGPASEDDYDNIRPSATIIRRRQNKSKSKPVHDATPSENSSFDTLRSLKTGKSGTGYSLDVDDGELREIVQRGLLRAKDPAGKGKRRPKFSDLVFTRKFSTFDRQSEEAASSPFHGFYTLFWMAVFVFMVKIAADNWRKYGNPLGTNEIMHLMFERDVVLLLLSDGIMCSLTGVSWLLQRLTYSGYLDWDRSGWIIQNLWQVMFIASVIGMTMLRDWPWSHTVFFVLHGLVMLMKQHSYAFYNGYLSSAWKKREHLLHLLKQLETVSLVPSADSMKERRQSVDFDKSIRDLDSIAAAIDSGEPLDEEQVQVFERMIKWEIDALTNELSGKSTTPNKAYPNNLTFLNHYEYIVLPTVVYELEYPRSDSINWYYAAEKLAACFGIIFVMIMTSQTFIYPVVMRTLEMKQENTLLAERFREFPWMLSELIFPFLMEYLLSWYLIWESILNLLAELTYFADRTFYGAWWNSVSWDQFARDWNRPVHNFLLRHVYHSSISAMEVKKHTATIITFFLSACIHELIMWCIFKKLRGYLLFLQMFQLPLVRLSRTKWLRDKQTLGNMIFWLGIFTGPSILCSLYLIL